MNTTLRELLNRFEAGKISLDEAMKAFFMLTNFVYDDKTISQLQKLAKEIFDAQNTYILTYE